MDLNTAVRLCGPEGYQAFHLTKSMPNVTHSRLERLTKKYGPEFARAVVLQLELRNRAKDKFELAEQMFFTREALEQSSSDSCAAWRASQFPFGDAVVDGCCGIGGDLIQFGARTPTLGIDLDPIRALFAQHNAKNSRLPHSVQVINGDVLKCIGSSSYLNLDPGRRSGGRRFRGLDHLSPNWDACRALAQSRKGAAVKLSPALSSVELESLPGRVEVVSLDGTCRETVCWLGNIGPENLRTATILPERLSFHGDPSTALQYRSQMAAYIFEPDPAIIAARLVGAFAMVHDLFAVSDKSTFLTGASLIATPFLTPYRVCEIITSHVPAIRKYLREHGNRIESIKTRGIELEPEKLIKEIGPLQGSPVTIILTHIQDRQMALICDRVRFA